MAGNTTLNIGYVSVRDWISGGREGEREREREER